MMTVFELVAKGIRKMACCQGYSQDGFTISEYIRTLFNYWSLLASFLIDACII